MKYSGVILLVTVFLMAEWTVSMSSALTAIAPSIGLRQKTEQAQAYKPPSRGTPTRREGGSTR